MSRVNGKLLKISRDKDELRRLNSEIREEKAKYLADISPLEELQKLHKEKSKELKAQKLKLSEKINKTIEKLPDDYKKPSKVGINRKKAESIDISVQPDVKQIALPLKKRAPRKKVMHLPLE